MANRDVCMDKDASSDHKWAVHIEVRLHERATARRETVKGLVHNYLTSSYSMLSLPSIIEGWEDVPELAKSVERIVASESSCPHRALPISDTVLYIHAYQPTSAPSFDEYANGDGEEEDTTAASVCDLPNRSWEGLWDSLIYADDIKMKLLDYIHATLLLSDANVDFNLISWNRVVLLHGPPGTGKTSLCRALAQKLSIRLSHRYSHSRLFEINSHSLFSKWFSESGKLVQRLFTSINELADEDDAFLVVLIDEVESLTAARAGAMAGTEPSDGLRVVNALLTQLDKLKHRKNVLIMSTSNLVKAIDSAFVDRADIVQYVDLPSREGIYEILRSSLLEIIKKGIICPTTVPSLEAAKMYDKTRILLNGGASNADGNDPESAAQGFGVRLLTLAGKCREQGMSGRALRRLPVLALARHLSMGQIPITSSHPNGQRNATKVEVWLDGMERVISDKSTELEHLI